MKYLHFSLANVSVHALCKKTFLHFVKLPFQGLQHVRSTFPKIQRYRFTEPVNERRHVKPECIICMVFPVQIQMNSAELELEFIDLQISLSLKSLFLHIIFKIEIRKHNNLNKPSCSNE